MIVFLCSLLFQSEIQGKVRSTKQVHNRIWGEFVTIASPIQVKVYLYPENIFDMWTRHISVICCTMDVQQMDIQRLPSFEVMIVTATWICAS